MIVLGGMIDSINIAKLCIVGVSVYNEWQSPVDQFWEP